MLSACGLVMRYDFDFLQRMRTPRAKGLVQKRDAVLEGLVTARRYVEYLSEGKGNEKVVWHEVVALKRKIWTDLKCDAFPMRGIDRFDDGHCRLEFAPATEKLTVELEVLR